MLSEVGGDVILAGSAGGLAVSLTGGWGVVGLGGVVSRPFELGAVGSGDCLTFFV